MGSFLGWPRFCLTRLRGLDIEGYGFSFRENDEKVVTGPNVESKRGDEALAFRATLNSKPYTRIKGVSDKLLKGPSCLGGGVSGSVAVSTANSNRLAKKPKS